jgi:peptide/nickel transport system ATP-binding protein
MERAPVGRLFDTPAHPYTRALLRCLPGRGRVTAAIGGSLPDPIDPPPGCRFAPRCPHAVDACRAGDRPPLYDVPGGDGAAASAPATGPHDASCVFYGPDRDPAALGTFDADGGASPGADAGSSAGTDPEAPLGSDTTDEGGDG